MARLNIKSTKATLIKLLKKNEERARYDTLEGRPEAIEETLLEVAKELEIEIKPEEYK